MIALLPGRTLREGGMQGWRGVCHFTGIGVRLDGWGVACHITVAVVLLGVFVYGQQHVVMQWRDVISHDGILIHMMGRDIPRWEMVGFPPCLPSLDTHP